jgi:hypothetical protein
LTAWATQLTYLPWFAASSHGQIAAMALSVAQRTASQSVCAAGAVGASSIRSGSAGRRTKYQARNNFVASRFIETPS